MVIRAPMIVTSSSASLDRISIVGMCGAGKTTMAAQLARLLNVAHLEIDELAHGPNWSRTPDEELARQLGSVVEGASWIVDGTYLDRIGDVVWRRATTVVWLDYPRRTLLRRVVVRSLRRIVTRQRLWYGNTERWSDLWRPDHPIRYVWIRTAQRRRQIEALCAASPAAGGSPPDVVRHRSPRDTRRWIEELHDAVERHDGGVKTIAPATPLHDSGS